MNKIAYTLFIAFVATVATLLLVNTLNPDAGASASGQRVISASELAQNDSAESCWKEINGRVYDITAYIPNHPTPERVIVAWCGKESTEAWDAIGGGRGHSAGAAAMLANYQIGVLEGAEIIDEPVVTAPARQQVSRPAVAGAPDQALLQDGSYYAELAPDGRGWIAMIEITVHNGRIQAVHYDEVQRNEEGAVTNSKLRDYGYAARWRNAVPNGVSQLSSYPAYARQLMIQSHPDQLDVISGATSSYNSFTEVAALALADAWLDTPLQAVGFDARSDYRDGSYYAESAPDGRGWIALLEVTILDGRVIAAHYDEVQRNEEGAVTNSKLRDYGYAARWRNAMPNGVSQLSSFPGYVQQLIATGDTEALDAFSGATSSYNNFRALAEQILEEAQ
ncbi:hypothetical protein NFC81_12400 [Salinispirillum sp. LH 10-3-1]|uniref:Cytochrome b5 heme-binding domain-containing protein n=1 Tax=Salinispirillum sp. LH 10-3-1 TaxID=2952525 RepID=A0AB38YE36_9GAMM